MAEPSQRASDAEREATAERLRAAAGDGRLDADELEERVAAAYAARTAGELEVLGADLPAVVAPAPPKPALWADEDVRRRAAGFVSVNVVCVAIWAATGADGHFWPVWVMLGTGVGLFRSVVHRLFGVEDRGHGHGWHGHGRHRHRSRHGDHRRPRS